VPKSREMMASWSVVGYAVWTCQFFPRQRVIVQSQKEDKVADLIKGVGNPGYARTLVERQTSWLREKYRLTKRMEDMPATMISGQMAQRSRVCRRGPTRFANTILRS
jgi:ABC-type phosphonate transport system ATPase subunit